MIIPDLQLKRFQTATASHPDPLSQISSGEESSIGNTYIKGVLQRTNRFGPCLLKTERASILIPLKVKGLTLGNLLKVDFHMNNLFVVSELGNAESNPSHPDYSDLISLGNFFLRAVRTEGETN